MYQLGIDIGGTFTDLVLLEPGSGRRFVDKVLTTPDDPAQGAIRGVHSILAAAGVDAAEVRQVIHGTTLVVNAIIERKGAPTGLLTTEGFRDILEMRRGRRFDMDDPLIEVPDPLVPRRLVREVPERSGHDGRVLRPLDEASAAAAIQALLEAGVEAIAVAFLHAFRNPAHEIRVGELVRAAAPVIAVSLSSEVAPDIREYERASTTVANAYAQPIMRGYLERLASGLADAGCRRELYLMLSDGGITTREVAVRLPIRLLESGPAGGTMAARWFGEQLGRKDLVAFDMGGTTSKISFIADGEVLTADEIEVARRYRFKRGSGLPVRIPVIQVMEIGAGGGGIAHRDGVGLLKVGPESAGAKPGPACYDRGGTRPTVTDANLLLGYLNADYFLGGEMALSIAAAERAMARLADELDLDPLRVAWGIHDIVTEDMAQAARLYLLEQGADPRGYALLAFGGAGPLHACRLARKLGMKAVVIPFGAGVASAFGFLVAPPSITLLKAYPAALADADLDHLNGLLAELEGEARQFLARAGVAEEAVSIRRFASCRYRGQGAELKVGVPDGDLGPGEIEDLATRFHEQFAAVYGRSNRRIPIEAMNWQVRASGPRPELATGPATQAQAEVSPRHRRAFFPESGGFVDCPVVARAALAPGSRLDGPLLVEERESTTVVLPGCRLEVREDHNLYIEV